jgi:LuxR family maltose regulon positive regulatory protein
MEFDATDFDDFMVEFHQGMLWITQGNLKAARRWAEKRGLDSDIDPARLRLADPFVRDRMRKYEQLVLARLLIAEARPAEAVALLDGVLPTMEQRRRIGRVIEIHVLKALAFQALGDPTHAMDALERALSLAEPEGYVRSFVDEGEPMGRLLRQAVARGIAVEYANRLLAALLDETKDERQKTDADSSPVPRPSSSLVEALSEREIEVLRLLTTSLSSTEIAEELVISVNTVRSHVKSIYAKLDAHSRYEALARAKELNLL